MTTNPSQPAPKQTGVNNQAAAPAPQPSQPSLPGSGPQQSKSFHGQVQHYGQPDFAPMGSSYTIQHPMHQKRPGEYPVMPVIPSEPPPAPEPAPEPVPVDFTHINRILDRAASSLGKTTKSSNFLFTPALDPASPTGRAGGIPAAPTTNPFDAGKNPTLAGVYDGARKLFLSPIINRRPEPFHTLRGRLSPAAAPYYTTAEALNALARPATIPGLNLLANYFGRTLGTHPEDVNSYAQQAQQMLGQ